MLEVKTIQKCSSSERHPAPRGRVFELSLREEKQETTAKTRLDPASIRALRGMFLLLDEWDRALQNSKTGHSPEEHEILIDSKPD